MRIGFDAKRAFSNYTGLGNYSRDTIRVLSTFFSENKYFLLKTNLKSYTGLKEMVGVICTDMIKVVN